MPDLATTGSAIRILRWLAKPGDFVTRGRVILEVETDKATMEVESTATGTLLEISAAEGVEVQAGEVMAIIRPAAPKTQPAGQSTKVSPAIAMDAPVAEKPASQIAPTRSSGAARQGPSSFPLSPARRTAARHLQLSKQTIPHYYLNMSANAGRLMTAREALPGKPAWDAFFVKAVAAALTRFELFQYRFEEDSLVRQEKDSIGVAAEVDGSLYVLRVSDSGAKSFEQISAEIRAQVEMIRNDEPGARRAKPGTITISNLGSTGVESFHAIISPPEAAILAVGAVLRSPYAIEDRVEVQWRVNLSLSVDHRIINGKYAAAFLANIVSELENI